MPSTTAVPKKGLRRRFILPDFSGPYDGQFCSDSQRIIVDLQKAIRARDLSEIERLSSQLEAIEKDGNWRMFVL